MKTKILSIALITSVITFKAQQLQTRQVTPFNKIEVSGSVNVFYTNSDTSEIKVSAADKEIENVETKVDGSILKIQNKGRFTKPVNIYIKNNQLNDLEISGASTFKSTNAIKADSINFSASGSTDVTINIESQTIKSIQSGASNFKLIGNTNFLVAELSGASTLKAFELITNKVNITTTGASNAKIFVNEKLNANASGASNIKIKGNVKDISAEASPAASITKIADEGKTTSKSGKDSTIYNWKGKKLIIIDADVDFDEKNDSNIVNQKFFNDDFHHWVGFSMGVNGYLDGNGSMNMSKANNYMDLNYGRSFNFQFNLFERHFNIVKNYFKVVTGFGFDYHSYELNRKTNLNPNTDNLADFGTIDTTNTYTYKKNKFRNTYIQIPLLLEFNTSNNPEKTVHLAFGVIGEYLISSRTKQVLEQNGIEVIKRKKDGYNLNPFAAKAHVNIGYKGFTAFGEYNLTPLFQPGKAPELYPFTVGVRLIPFN